MEKDICIREQYVFFEDIYPILFLAADSCGRKYIASMCDDREEFRWIIASTDMISVQKMLANEITMRELFKLAQGSCFICTESRNIFDMRCVSVQEIPEEDLPTDGIYFDADESERRAFNRFLMEEPKKRMKQRRQHIIRRFIKRRLLHSGQIWREEYVNRNA